MEFHCLTTPQQNIWNLQKYYPGTAISNICGSVFFPEKKDSEKLLQAIRLVIQSQTALQLRFHEGELPEQYVADEADADILTVDFASMEEFDRYAEEFAQRPIELTGGSMYRMAIAQVADRTGILLCLSHLVADAWTFGLLVHQLEEAYHRVENGVGALSQWDYADFIQAEQMYLASEQYQRDRQYWEEKYSVADPGQSFEKSIIKLCSTPAASIKARRISTVLPVRLEQRIAAFCEEYSVTPAVLFETAVMVYLAKGNRENPLATIGIPVLNRNRLREKKTAGMFVSTMPLTVATDQDMSVSELAERITKSHMELFRHQKYPYANILKALREKQNFSGNLYDVMVSYQNAVTGVDAETKWYSNGYSEIPLAIHIDNRDGRESHTLTVDYQTELFDREEVQYLIERLEYIFEQITECGNRRIRDIRIVPAREYEKITGEFDDTAVDYPRDKCVHELFEEQVRRTPEATALVAVDRTLSYRELNALANRIAHALIAKGIQTGDIVAFALPRKSYMIAAMLGILKSGAAYMPIDSEYPRERIDFMLTDSQAKLFITEENIGEYIDFSGEENICLKMSSHSPCYCIYTSGSTGTPKGTVLHHQGIVNLLCYRGLYSVLDECEHIALLTTITFDVATQEIFTTLLTGRTGYLFGEKNKLSIAEVITSLSRNQIDMFFCTPSYLNTLTQKEDHANTLLKTVKCINLAGEKFYVNDIIKAGLRNLNVVFENQYGPAETHVITTTTVHNLNDITIGRPIANTQIYILDADDNPLPIGVAGELCIAGDGVGLGYLNRPELTAERFVENPFATGENGHGKTMYRTGDLARWRADGEIEYLGRIDTQVKIRGLRIELGEIESVMAGFPGIALCAVTDKKDEDGRQYLVGYYTTETEIDEKALRQHLSAKLPKYMVPNYFMRLDAMPMTPSGKTDRKNLPVPDLTVQAEEYIAPQTDTEIRLAEIWKSLLKIERISRNDDFFDLGGDSLLAISLLSELETVFSAELSMRDILEKPTLEQLAACIERHIGQYPHGENRITAHHKDRYILLPQQKAIYAACQKAPEALLYNMPAKIALPADIDRDRLKEAIRQVMLHRKILRTYIAAEANEIYGVYDENADLIFEEYTEGTESEFVRPFALDKAPLFRVGFTENALLFDIHHIIADGETLSIILRDIVRAYQGHESEGEKVWHGDYAEYFYSCDFSTQKDYFREMLKCDFERIELPLTKEGGTGGVSLVYMMPEETVKSAKKYAAENGLTDTMVFLGAYGILLSKYTAKKDVLSSVILQNRVHRDVRDMAGMFVNTLPIHFAVKGDTKEYFREVKETMLNLFRYQEQPFWEIADAVGMQDKTVVNTSFVYQADGEKKLILDGQDLTPKFIDTGTAKFDFSMELTPLEQDCRMRLEYDCSKYDHALMDELAAAYVRTLEQLTKESIADISVLSDEMYRKVIEEFNDTAVDYPREKCVHELFEEQVRRTPERTALVFQEQKFTYRELDEMSNSLAHFLREKGVGRGDVVPIIARRSWHIVVAMLGVLKAGAAYMPVSPDYPEERIAYVLETAKSRIALTYGYTGNLTVECVKLEKFDFQSDISPIVNTSQPGDLCYVIFTSGSTGTPKGVSVSHRNVGNYCNNNNNNVCSRIIKDGYRSIVSVTNIVFDIFVTETLLPLLNGLTIYFADDEEAMRQDRLAELVNRNGIEVMQTTPTRMRSYMLDKKKCSYLKNLKAIILGGEAFPVDLYAELRKYTEADIFNIYGPAETTVWSTNADVNGTDITIGRPIANTQIYIIDADSNPLPIGVAGELCIAGDGVGLGYLNRPELTAERFVENPFATEANGHGKTMYRTGDLARWRADGEIEYLGRIDTQVKIRGLRIELGEIESAMAGFPGIALCAVTDKKDEDGRQYLVGYYTVADADSDTGSATDGTAGIDERALRQHLSAKLPKYMVPNYFMRLDAMPMTPSGKTDRKNLPVPDLTMQAEEYIAPETEREKTLCHLLEKMLGAERVGVEDDFFAWGGDSLLAIEYVARAHDAGIDFPLQCVFDHPTVRSLCEYLDGAKDSKVHYEEAEFEKYQEIFARNVVDEDFVPVKKTLGNVLLTGATGFLGAHVLDCLMREETGVVYCLVRSGSEGDRRGRLREILHYYFDSRYDEEIGRRIIPVVGDIEDDRLADELLDSQIRDVQTLIHTAASVKHFGSYEYFRRVNCEGTRHVAEFADRVGAKLIHISTLSVSGNSMADDFSVYRSEEEKHFYETSLYIGQPLDNVYIRSKFEAERVVYDRMLDGLDAKVIRVGNLTNRLSDFKFQPNYRENAFLTREKAMLEFGLFPDYLLPLYSEFSPIDKTAEGIVRIAQYADRQCVFHLYNNRHLYFERFLEIMRQLDIPMKVVDGAEFYKALQQTLKNPATAYIYEAFQNDMDEQGRLVYDSNIRINGDFTVWFLRKAGFEWNEIDLEYIRGYVEYFRGLGYLKV